MERWSPVRAENTLVRNPAVGTRIALSEVIRDAAPDPCCQRYGQQHGQYHEQPNSGFRYCKLNCRGRRHQEPEGTRRLLRLHQRGLREPDPDRMSRPANGEFRYSAGAQRLAGGAVIQGAPAFVAIDTSMPQVTIDQAVCHRPTKHFPVNYTAQFSEPVVGQVGDLPRLGCQTGHYQRAAADHRWGPKL